MTNRRNKALLLAGFCASFLSTSALAATRVPGTYTYYSVIKDPITDLNKSMVSIDEVNDTAGLTALTVRCSDRDNAALWITLNSKNMLLSEDDAYAGNMPALTVRLGQDAPVVLRSSEVVSVSDSSDNFKGKAVGFQGAAARSMVSGLLSGKNVVVRVNRPAGGQPLTYTFPAQGFSQAWSAVRACAPFGTGAASRTPAPLPSGTRAAEAPKFTRWYFTTCRDASSGAVRTGLLAGRAALCDLVIETIPNGARPVSATFHYELEYREGGRTGKLPLTADDHWPPSGGPVTRFRNEGSNLVFTLPLNVRVRSERVYTSINVTAEITFNNGSVKRVYEPLPVRPN